jgi:hypothetical protein
VTGIERRIVAGMPRYAVEVLAGQRAVPTPMLAPNSTPRAASPAHTAAFEVGAAARLEH